MEETICVFGASSTFGAYDKEKGGWVNRLRLNLESEDKNVTIYNLGINGDTTKEVLERVRNECFYRSPTILIFSIGDNDSLIEGNNGPNRTSIDEFEFNIYEIIKIAREFSSKILFLGLKKVDETKTRPVSWDKNVIYKNSEIIRYDERLREILVSEDIDYIHLFNILELKDLDDGLHPISKGHNKIALKVKNFLKTNKWV